MRTERWTIFLTEPQCSERAFTLQDGSLLFGASQDCDIVSAAPGVAPHHLELLAGPGRLQIQNLGDSAITHLNGVPIHGLVDVSCPAKLQIGGLQISIDEVTNENRFDPSSDSTINLIHSGRPASSLPTDPDGLDLTGRIVHSVQEPNQSPSPSLPPTGSVPSPTAVPSFSEGSTMAYSMESLDLAIADKVPVRMDYEVKSEIARGGMGKIYSVEDAELDRLVALKVSTVADRSKDSQFFREAKILAALAHPNIVPVYNVGADTEGRPFYSMKLIQGRTLQWIIKQLAVGDSHTATLYTRERLLDIFRKICDAMTFAHARGYLHRDLKPENIMVGEFGEVLVMDWGLAKSIRKTHAGADTECMTQPEPEIVSYIEGTPQYMSPEQANGVYGGLDERSDIYSLGGILYAILMLKPPVNGSTLNEVLAKVRNGETTTMTLPRDSVRAGAEPPLIRAVPESLRSITMKALSREPKRRYQTVEALAKDIEAYQNGFVTSAEDATPLRQFVLLVKRHRAASVLVALLLCGAFMFTVRLAASEKRAKASAQIAEKNAQRAEEQSRIAIENARLAQNEKEAARQEAAMTNISRAESYEKKYNAEEMEEALARVPEDLRSQRWHYMSQLLNSSARTISSKDGSNWTACTAHPGKPGVFVTLQENQWLRSLDLSTGEAEDLFKLEKKYEPQNLAVSNDGKRVALARTTIKSKNSEVTIIDVYSVPDGKLLCSIETPAVRDSWLKFNSDGSLLLKVARRGWVENAGLVVMDVEKGEVLWKRDKIDDSYDAFFNELGETLYLSSAKNGLQEFETQTGNLKKLITSTLVPRGYLPMFFNRSLFLFKADAIRRIEKDGEAGYEVQFLTRGQTPIEKLRSEFHFLPDSKILVRFLRVAEKSALLDVRDLRTGEAIIAVPVLLDRNKGNDWITASDPSTNQVAVIRGNCMKVWSFSRAKAQITNQRKTNRFIRSELLVGLTSQLLQVSEPRRKSTGEWFQPFEVSELEPSTPKKVPIMLEELTLDHNLFYARSSRNGKLATTWSRSKDTSTLTVYRIDQNTMVEQKRKDGFPGSSGYFVVSPDGNSIWTGGSFYDVQSHTAHPIKNNVELRPIEEKAVWTDNDHVAGICVVENQEKGKSSAVTSIVLWNALQKTLERWTPASSARVLASSPDCRTLAEGGSDQFVRIRDASTLAITQTIRVHDAPVVDLAWHPKLPYLATIGEDFRVRIWEPGTARLLDEIGILEEMPSSLQWSPNGQTLFIRGQQQQFFFNPESCRP